MVIQNIIICKKRRYTVWDAPDLIKIKSKYDAKIKIKMIMEPPLLTNLNIDYNKNIKINIA